MNAALKQIINEDLDRCFGKNNRPAMYKLMNPSVRCTIALRKAAFYSQHGNGLQSFWARLRYLRLSQRFLFSIPYNTKIGRGLQIGHTGSVIINEGAVLGENINVATGVVIGIAARGEKAGCPTIGNCVWIGANAIIVGDVTIGEDVLIAPGAYVNFDVPSHAVVIGNPGTIHPKENATQGYINNKV